MDRREEVGASEPVKESTPDSGIYNIYLVTCFFKMKSFYKTQGFIKYLHKDDVTILFKDCNH